MSGSLNIDWFVGDKVGVLHGPNPAETPGALRELEREGHVQVVTVRPWMFTMAWRLPACGLRNVMVRATGASDLSEWDLFRLNELCVYELIHGRTLPIWFEDTGVRDEVVASISRFFHDGLTDLDAFVARAMATQRERYAQLGPEPARLSGCCYCHDGACLSDLVCHATTVESAISIVRSGRILSACKARGVSGEVMATDPRNAAGDPPDYFEYVMFGAGNCTAVDKLVLERVIGSVPSWDEFENVFQPPVRFYFRNDALRSHPGFTLDGIHEKIHGELALEPCLTAIVVPDGIAGSDELVELSRRMLGREKVVRLSFDGMHYKDWARMAYREVSARAYDRQT